LLLLFRFAHTTGSVAWKPTGTNAQDGSHHTANGGDAIGRRWSEISLF